MYINGHGLLNHSIAHISLDAFRIFLQFLDSKIVTCLLVVLSCYAAGINANKIYGEIKLGTQSYYSFPIIIQGINDAPAIAYAPQIDMNVWFKNQEIKVKTMQDFGSFFKEVINKEGSYSEIIKPIAQNFIQNTPQIKLPGIEWFSVMDADKKIISIGSILAQTRDSQKPLDVVSFFKKDPEIILLYTDDIPFELVLRSNKLKAIISMVSSGPFPNMPEFVIHRIKKISWQHKTFDEICLLFSFVKKTNKWFCIDEIDGNKDILIFSAGDNVKWYYQTKSGTLCLTGSPGGLFRIIDYDSPEGKEYLEKMGIAKGTYRWEKARTDKTISLGQVQKIYPAQQGKQKYEEISSFYPWMPSWLRSWLISRWNIGK